MCTQNLSTNGAQIRAQISQQIYGISKPLSRDLQGKEQNLMGKMMWIILEMNKMKVELRNQLLYKKKNQELCQMEFPSS